MDKVIAAYLAGAIDSDGSIGIKRSTYARRVRKDATNPTYSERIMLKQVTPQIPALLHEYFHGYLRQEKPSCKENGKPLWSWQVTDKNASHAAEILLPYLRVKKRQAEILLELRESKGGQFKKLAYWFVRENPNWRRDNLLTTTEAMQLLPYKHKAMLSQAVKNGSIVALPYDHRGTETPRFPRALIEQYAALSNNSPHRCGGKVRPQQLIAWRERLFAECRELNKIGVHGTQVNHRTGCHTPVEG